MAAVASNHFVSWDDFVRIRNSQDEHIGREFTTLRQTLEDLDRKLNSVEQSLRGEIDDLRGKVDGLRGKIDRLKGEIDRLKGEIDVLKDEIRELRGEIDGIKDEIRGLRNDIRGHTARFDRLEQRFDHLELDNIRMAARFQNFMLKNPVLRITPLPAYDPTHGIRQPNAALFPRHAKDFYALRHPSNDRHRQMLAYLVSFYDIQLSIPESSYEEDEDEVGLEESDSERAAELLEGILGLNEDNFIKFRERAAEMGRRRTPPATKRSQPPAQEGYEAEGPRQRLQLRPYIPAEDKSFSSEDMDHGRLLWRARTRSTPPSQRITLNNLLRATADAEKPAEELADRPTEETAAPPAGSGASSLTRPFTNPREP
ncbi:hypothetical protein F5144DRAFT_401227 [Chaetomium tenue]|uniref:Uncharacterized protein n=1 Tax=Chaetomium tenue TaxID=1854479 RepID=A0ACB7NYT0_9PEZI|nr:hypothetical protein F5144DRAFT_401227 [Chaetomium globosum]